MELKNILKVLINRKSTEIKTAANGRFGASRGDVRWNIEK